MCKSKDSCLFEHVRIVSFRSPVVPLIDLFLSVNKCNVTIDHGRVITQKGPSNVWVDNTRLDIECEELREAKPSSFILKCREDGTAYALNGEIPKCYGKN